MGWRRRDDGTPAEGEYRSTWKWKAEIGKAEKAAEFD